MQLSQRIGLFERHNGGERAYRTQWASALVAPRPFARPYAGGEGPPAGAG